MSHRVAAARDSMQICRLAAALLLIVHAGLISHLAVRYSPTIDEVGHLPAGLYVWEFVRFDVFRVNPPFVRTWATLPVWLAGCQRDWSGYREGFTARPEWRMGRDFLQANGEQAFRYFTWARWMLIPLSVLGGLICFRWASELYGQAAGLAALSLWCFSPTVLAYGALITPDLGAAALGVTASYVFWRWLKHPSGRWTLLGGLMFGLALLTKMTWIVLFALWPLLWIAWKVVEGGRSTTLNSRCSTLNELSKLVALLLLGLYVLNLGYGFRGTFDRLGDYRFVSRTLSGQTFTNGETESGRNRFAGTCLERVPVPLPRDYVTGIDLQKWEFEQGKWSYLRGEWKFGGWWWYYLYAAAVKEPLGTWCLLGLAAIAAWKSRRGTWSDNRRTNVNWKDALVLLAPGIVLFVLVSSQTGFNRYLRYVLPAFPFFFIWASQAVRLVEQSRWWALPVGGAIAWSAASSLWVYPHSLSYFNEAVGGPARGHEHLIDANIDWGQDLFALRDWLRDHPEAVPVRVVCQAFVPLEVLGIERQEAPAEPRPGWFIVSRHDRRGRSGKHAYFDRFEPIERIGQSMDVFRLTPVHMDLSGDDQTE